ncbi:diadenylate cyclase CdaA [Streptococcus moroccensis]|uniref:Diadenylate cyclase n=1 Tax=Streptococcus moroccensis TaxID=1451356 RepID=A0ABT9YPJ7_9STRE|nr:diadenylate cyclase CdaA [Streptococcus moroccensis]MDQ0221920.1 diadenylate cyclase [Streptococcus moroccensis]
MSFTQLLQFSNQFWQSLVADPWRIVINSLDIFLVTALMYMCIKALSGTRVMTLLRGVALFVMAQLAATFLGFQTISFILNQIFTYGVIAAVVIFAPEIRSALEKLGRSATLFASTNTLSDEERLISSFLKATDYMCPRKIGALVSVEGTQSLKEFISTGIPLDADISSELLINIFIPNTPLHDGAVIVRDNKIAVSCAYLPLTESTSISKEFGTRHRAAIGLSEQTDAFTFIVSEETGSISVTHNGVFKHDLTREEFKAELQRVFISEEATKAKSKKWFAFWEGK